MRSAEQPANAKCNQRGGVELLFNELADNIADRMGQFGSVLLNLPIQVLGRSTDFVGQSFGLHFGVACQAANTLLCFPCYFPGRPFQASFVHTSVSRFSE